MLEDWRNVDLNSITKQTLYTMEDSRDEHRKLIIQLYQEFDHLLEEQSPIESYIEWLDTMVDRCVVKVGKLERKGQPWVLQHFTCLCEQLANTEPPVSHRQL
ncbi:Hypothetical predicted protein [Marmota monax]|uniref:RFX1-4/6/8-like BCD domain-containing protein n=1 Tax=Marmota monax TaxID=9995 RepID=A0A5E4A4N3_MARMO|nr:hypothetical protein GHT09_006419 [Marmota monax]VTJ52064.1 Hypothetical predicted protein [Marmota monax]